MADFVRDDIKEVVTDTTTCLMWQDDGSAAGEYMEWEDAIDYCEDMNFAGFDDWRLPNFNELYSIGDRSKVNPAIKDTFKNVSSSPYWSSTTYVGSTSVAWRVNLRYGDGYYGNKLDDYDVRCVRDGQ